MTEDISLYNNNNSNNTTNNNRSTVNVQDDSNVTSRDITSDIDVNFGDHNISLAEIHDENTGDIVNDQPESVTVNNSIYDKKSFRITNVTVQHNLIRSTTSNVEASTNESDNIDMSAINSQVERSDCSYTQNIICKDDVLYKVTSLGSAPIIPTSAQYGIAVVSNPNSEFVDNENKFVTDGKLSNYRLRSEYLPNGLNGNCGANLSNKEFNARNERFKVVKIESNEPFRRGRWVCMDFLDQSMDQVKKAATTLNDSTCKQKDSSKEPTSEGTISNGLMNTENTSAETENIPQNQLQGSQQLSNESSNHINGEVPNTVSPNQAYTMPFVSPSKVMQPQSQPQSLTHIIIPQVSQASNSVNSVNPVNSVVSGSYGHCQVMPISEIQHSQTSQQQPLLQQAYVSVPTSQPQTMISQPLQHSPHPQSETMLNQTGIQQQQPILPQSYQSVPQSNTSVANNTDSSLLQQQNAQVNPSSLPPPSSALNNQHFSAQQQIPQQTYSQSTAQPQNISQPASVQQLSNQHHHQIASQTQASQSNSQSQCNMPQQPVHIPTQTSINQSSIQQSSLQYTPQQSQSVVSQSANHPQAVQSHPQQMMLQAMTNPTGGNGNGNNGCGNDSQQMMHVLQQQQQMQHQQSLQHTAAQTSPSQQTVMQQQSSQQHHQPLIQSVPQQQQHHHQPQQQQQPAPQLLQSQIASGGQNVSQMNIQHQTIANQNTATANQHSSPQIMPTSLQNLPQQQTQSHNMLSSHQQLPQQTQSLQTSVQVTQQPLQPPMGVSQGQPLASNGNQTVQSQYQNIPGQINDSNIPVSVPQPTHQLDVLPNLSQPDLILPSQYPQTQNMTSAHASHVSVQQSYPNTSSQHVNTSNINLVPISVSTNQQQSQSFYGQQVIPCSLASCSMSSQSQDLQQSCTHQLQNIPSMQQQQSSMMMPNLGHQGQHLYSVPSQVVYSQNGATVVSQAALSNVQTQTTPVLQTCTTSAVPVQHYSMPSRSVSSSTCGTAPVTTTYPNNVGGMQPNQQLSSSTVGVSTPAPSNTFLQFAQQPYAAGQSAPPGGTDQTSYCCTSSHFREQVAECVRNEESSLQRSAEETDSSTNSGNSVAIDNKIEQAMDLVKSHLMFAVREEVEVLKEKIAELMDRINQLEMENSFLKANATQETLAQLPALYQQSLPSAVSVSNSTRPSSVTPNTNASNSNTTNQPP